jgi:hypothetical protein
MPWPLLLLLLLLLFIIWLVARLRAHLCSVVRHVAVFIVLEVLRSAIPLLICLPAIAAGAAAAARAADMPAVTRVSTVLLLTVCIALFFLLQVLRSAIRLLIHLRRHESIRLDRAVA